MRNDNRIPWWIWPNVLNLDAPAIALAWQEVFARSASVSVRPAERAALFGAVWIVYAADRWLDGIRLRVGTGAAHRHRFSHRHAWAIGCVLVVATLIEIAIVGRLPIGIVIGGMMLGGLVAVYFAWNHLAGPRLGRGKLKEVVVSLVFAAGAGMVPWLEGASADLTMEIGAFAVVCLANCLLIARLERERDIERGELSIAGQLSPDARPARLLAALFVGAMTVWLLAAGADATRVALLGAGVLMIVATRVETRWGNDAACVCADLALLLPAVAVLVRS